MRRNRVHGLLLALIALAGLVLPDLLSIPKGQVNVVRVLFFCFWFLGVATFNRAVFAGLGSIGLIELIDQVGRVKMRLLNVPFRADDITVFLGDFRSNIEVLWDYPKAVWLIALTIGIFLTGTYVALRYERPLVRAKGARAVFYRILFAFFVAIAGVRLWVHKYDGLIRAFNHPVIAGSTTYTQVASVRGHATTCNVAQFVSSFAELGVWVPGGETSAERYLKAVAPMRATQGKAQGRRPDLFVILEESMFDPRILADYPHTGLPALDETGGAVGSLDGTLRVHTYGGGTCLAELALLAGFYWGEFGPAGSYAPYVVTPHLRSSLVHQLKSLGYHTIVVASTVSSFLGARQAYANYGFDEVYGLENLNLPKTWTEVADEDVMKFAEARAASFLRKGQPVFVFMLTIRNHGPHSRLLPERAAQAGSDPIRTQEMRDYLDRLQDSSRALSSLQKRWLAPGHERLMMFFGDHLPSFEGKIKQLQPAERRFNYSGEEVTWNRTPFAIRANFPLAPLNLPKSDLDIAFLGSVLLDSAGVEPGPYYSELRLLGAKTDYKWVDAPDRELVTSFLTHVVKDLGIIK